MTEARRIEIEIRWQEIARELQAISDGKSIAADDIAAREGALLEERDALEHELGLADFHQ